MMHIDGDALVYIAGFAADSRNGPFSHSAHNIKLIINKALDVTGEDEYRIFLTSTDPDVNFRTKILPTYKQNRVKQCKTCQGTVFSTESFVERYSVKGNLMKRRMYLCLNCQTPKASTKPVYYNRIRRYLSDYYGAMTCPWGETDDWLLPGKPDWVATHDKDIPQTRGQYYNLKSGKVLEVTSELGFLDLIKKQMKTKEGAKQFNKNGTPKNTKEVKGGGFKWFCYQMIYGDLIDNIIKIKKGDGPVFIYNKLNGLGSLRECWNFVKTYYTEAGTQDQLWIMAQLIWCARKRRQQCSEQVIEDLINEHDN